MTPGHTRSSMRMISDLGVVGMAGCLGMLSAFSAQLSIYLSIGSARNNPFEDERHQRG